MTDIRARRLARVWLGEGEMNNTRTLEIVEPIRAKRLTQKSKWETASRALRSRKVQESIQELLEERLSKDARAKLLERNAKQYKNIPASNSAIEIASKIAGDFAPDRSIQVRFTLPPGKTYDQAVEELYQEHRKLVKLLEQGREEEAPQ